VILFLKMIEMERSNVLRDYELVACSKMEETT
jgi:hypothetical protein